jgi:hypothetical protein
MSEHTNRALLTLMKDLSQKYYHKEWENGLEYILWHWIFHSSPMSTYDVNRLYMAHNRANGWFAILDEESEEKVFMSSDKWVKLFQEEFDGAVN